MIIEYEKAGVSANPLKSSYYNYLITHDLKFSKCDAVVLFFGYLKYRIKRNKILRWMLCRLRSIRSWRMGVQCTCKPTRKIESNGCMKD